MTHLLLLALLAADPPVVAPEVFNGKPVVVSRPAVLVWRDSAQPDAGADPGATDVPVLIDEHGSKTTITGVEPLAPGTVCLTHLKAASVRDDLADKNARVASLEKSLGTNWPVVGIVVLVGVVATGAAAAVGYVAGQNSKR